MRRDDDRRPAISGKELWADRARYRQLRRGFDPDRKAAPCKRINPVTSETIEIIERREHDREEDQI
jgi:hypothetical protein